MKINLLSNATCSISDWKNIHLETKHNTYISGKFHCPFLLALWRFKYVQMEPKSKFFEADCVHFISRFSRTYITFWVVFEYRIPKVHFSCQISCLSIHVPLKRKKSTNNYGDKKGYLRIMIVYKWLEHSLSIPYI